MLALVLQYQVLSIGKGGDSDEKLETYRDKKRRDLKEDI
jgi:hypothetical protein